MTRAKPQSLPEYAFAHHVGVGNGSYTYGTQSDVHKAYDRGRDTSAPHAWNETIARCGEHVCLFNRSREFYDRIGNEYFFLGRAASKADAISRWKNHLMSVGARPEEAVTLDG